ncbi:GGDEF domain-containing protein [Cohnella candidum]|uniref:GGDEF domain-containing protein n=1 Tax=Cohnella candidum TaxID=2674991 RepID=A0A3G3K1A8_9BACL|nr:GGDEF domain-containing protein [Cohnella candidum]AYQ74334.1 GGDEF domain-containing protein [Cohnella candidum]
MTESYFENEKRTFTRDILTTLWRVIVLYAVVTGANSFVTAYDQGLFLRDVVFIPALEMVLLCGLLELCFRYVRTGMDFVLLAGVNLLVSLIILALYELPMSVYLLIFPLLISLFYFSGRLIAFAVLQGLVTLALLYWLSPHLSRMLTVSNAMLAAAMLAGTAMVINSLRKRMFSLANNLVSATEEKQKLLMQNVEMERNSRIDPVTRLYNHKSFHEHLGNILAMQASASMDVHLALLDIDNFKVINDTYGHAAGDVIIKFVADRISDRLEADDFASRYGGEEFGIICVEKNGARFQEQLERIREDIAAQTHELLDGNRVTVSIGFQRLQADMSKEKLFEAADSALYAAKRSGKNKTVQGSTLP